MPRKTLWRVGILSLSLSLLPLACEDPTGGLGESCRRDGTCNPGLHCYSDSDLWNWRGRSYLCTLGAPSDGGTQ